MESFCNQVIGDVHSLVPFKQACVQVSILQLALPAAPACVQKLIRPALSNLPLG